jgi:27-O-demethylrifamycin SV methyltransferase
VSYQPSTHYDRVTAAWTLLLGDELHYGVFERPDEQLAVATGRLTRLMSDAGRIEPGHEVLDVGCGTGAPACFLAAELAARVTGITTSVVGLAAARARATGEGLDGRVSFAQQDGMDNGFPDASFDRVWVLESSHLMPDRDRLLAECARVLRPGGRLVLCDIMLRRPMDFAEVRRLLRPLALLRDVFGDARMEPIAEYRRLAEASGLEVVVARDLTAETRPTFQCWRDNAERHHDEVASLLGEDDLRRFTEACDVLAGFWGDGTLGYGVLSAAKPARGLRR